MARREPIDTPAGRIELLLPDYRRMGAAGDLWPGPMGVIAEPDDVDNERAKVVLGFEEGPHEVRGSYMYGRAVPAEEAERRLAANRRIAARAIARLVAAKASDGLVLTCATLREEPEGMVPGIALFLSPGIKDATSPPADDREREIDRVMGPGYARLLGRVVTALEEARAPDRLAAVGLGAASAGLMGRRWLDFMLVSGVVYCLQERIEDQDPAWEALARVGVREVVHAPVGADRFPRQRPDDALDPQAAERVYRILCLMAHVDGRLDPAERALLERYRQRLGVDPERAAELERQGIAGEELRIGRGAVERDLMLAGVLEVVAADGEIAATEEHELFELGRALKLPQAMIEEAILQRTRSLSEGAGEGTSENGLRRIYHALCRMAACDGEIAPRERARLDAFRIRHGIGAEEGAGIEAEALREDELRIGKHPAERWQLMDELVSMAAADGALDPGEKERVLTFAQVMGLDPAEVERRLELAVATSSPTTPNDPLPVPAPHDPALPFRIARLQRELAQLDQEHGPCHELHAGVLFQLSVFHEVGGNHAAAASVQERLLDVGARLGVDAGDLGQGWRRLARLRRAAGQEAEAAQADEKVRELLGL